MDTRPTRLQHEWFCQPPTRLRMASICATSWLAAGLQCLRGNCCRNAFGILMYHRVANRVPGVDAPTSNVTPDRLRCQLAGLLALGFEAWPLSKLASFHRAARPIPHNAFAVTFDDGYENNYTNAWPVLRELNVPATIFLATKYLDSDRAFPFDDWSAAGRSDVPTDAWRPLSTGQCQEMLASGLIELGAHTHSHERFLGRCDVFRSDMTLCLGELKERFGIVEPTFAYPYGDVSAELALVARRLGVVCSVTTRHQQVRATDDICQWGRFYAGATDTSAVLAGKLTGWYSAVASAGKSLTRPFSRRHWNAGRPANSANPLPELKG